MTTESDYTAEDIQPRQPDRRTPFRRHWRTVALIVVGFSAVQVLWLLALGMGR